MRRYKAYLFDLDGTLIRNNLRPFMASFSKLLAHRIESLMPLDVFQTHMDRAVKVMIHNEGPRTNQEVFIESFFAGLNYSPEEVMPRFEAFYAEDFRTLSQAGEFKPAVPALLSKLVVGKASVVIATNPIFPLTAIEQRLAWAGLGDLTFDLVTSYENSCATKASSKYYQDICDAVAIAPQECLMIGDQAWDLTAAQIGCDTFLVPSPNTDVDGSGLIPTHSGSIADLAGMLEIV